MAPWVTDEPDYELEPLLSLDGHEFIFAEGYVVKYEVRRVRITKVRPQGIRYTLTLHDPEKKRIYGIDNAHKAGRRSEFDHKHVYSHRKVVPYRYHGPIALPDDFLHEVERILKERGA
jgi:hypothetical protein